METNVNKKENSIVEIEVNADKVAWQAAIESEWKKAGANLEVKGFRKGSAPLSEVKKSISEGEVLMAAADAMLNDMYRHGLEASDIWPVAQPTLDIKAMTNDELIVIFSVTVKPEVELGEYKGLSADKETAVVSEDDIQQQIDALMAQSTNLEVVDRAIAEGDTAVIDFEGFKDGVPFDGGKGEGYPLEIGSGSFIPGFEEKLVGAKAGDEVDVDVTFPEQYQEPTLAGQPVLFKVKVNEVKEKVAAELNDEFVKTLGVEGVEDVAGLKADISSRLLEQKQQEAEMNYTNALVDQVLENTKVDIPQAMIDAELEAMYNQFIQRLQMQGMNEEMFLQMTQQEKPQVMEQMQDDAIKKIKYTLVLEKIAEVENVQVSDADIEAEYEKLAGMYNMPVDQIKQMLGDSSGLEFELKMQKAADAIKNNVK